jgi:hypothetical protein
MSKAGRWSWDLIIVAASAFRSPPRSEMGRCSKAFSASMLSEIATGNPAFLSAWPNSMNLGSINSSRRAAHAGKLSDDPTLVRDRSGT